jgi:hypothetical protein
MNNVAEEKTMWNFSSQLDKQRGKENQYLLQPDFPMLLQDMFGSNTMPSRIIQIVACDAVLWIRIQKRSHTGMDLTLFLNKNCQKLQINTCKRKTRIFVIAKTFFLSHRFHTTT